MQQPNEGESCKECGQRSPRYNGWRNYETWAVKLWLDNEEPSYRYWSERTSDAISSALDMPKLYESQTAEDRARSILADWLKEDHEERAEALGLYDGEKMVGAFSDLYRAAESEVDWHEIASSMLDAAKESDEPKP